MRSLLLLCCLTGCFEWRSEETPPDLGPVPPTPECPLMPVETREEAESIIVRHYECHGHTGAEVTCPPPETVWACAEEVRADYHVIGYEISRCTATVGDDAALSSTWTIVLDEHTVPAVPLITPRGARTQTLCDDTPECITRPESRFGLRDGATTPAEARTSVERTLRCCGVDPAEFDIECWGPAECPWGHEAVVDGVRAIGDIWITCRVFDAAEGAGLFWSFYPLGAMPPRD